MQLPRHAGCVGCDLFIAFLRIDAIGLDVLVHADVANGIRIGINVGKVRPLARVGLDKNHFGVHFEAGADGFGERIARLHGHVNAALFVLRIGIQNHRHLRQSREGLQVGVFERAGQLHGNQARTIAKDRLAEFDGELEPAGNDREIGEVAAPKAGGVLGDSRLLGHNATLRPRAFRGWQCASKSGLRSGFEAQGRIRSPCL